MKKVFYLVIFALCALVTSCEQEELEDPTRIEVDGIYYLLHKDGTAEVTYKGYTPPQPGIQVLATVLDIPKKVTYEGKRYKVTSIGETAFMWQHYLTSVTIPTSVKNIGEGAFSGCKGLTSFTIPNSVTTIGRSAFGGCSGLTSLTISNSLTSIEEATFFGCEGLTSIEIPGSVTTIGDRAFGSCVGLTSVTIHEGVTSIGVCAFGVCYNITSVTLPSSLTSIDRFAFYYNAGLQKIYSYAAIPPACADSVFDHVEQSAVEVYVPASSVGRYKMAPTWRDFNNIKALPTE